MRFITSIYTTWGAIWHSCSRFVSMKNVIFFIKAMLYLSCINCNLKNLYLSCLFLKKRLHYLCHKEWCLSVCLSNNLSICQCVTPLYIRLSVCNSFILSVCLCVIQSDDCCGIHRNYVHN